MTSKARFEYTATSDSARVAEYLSKIAEGLAAGSVSLAAHSESINLTPAGVVRLTIEADGNPERSRGSITLEISWRAASELQPLPLEISTTPRVEKPAASHNGKTRGQNPGGKSQKSAEKSPTSE